MGAIADRADQLGADTASLHVGQQEDPVQRDAIDVLLDRQATDRATVDLDHLVRREIDRGDEEFALVRVVPASKGLLDVASERGAQRGEQELDVVARRRSQRHGARVQRCTTNTPESLVIRNAPLRSISAAIS